MDGQVIMKAREARWMTRDMVAAAVGLSKKHIQNIELGQTPNPRVDDVMILCSYIGVDPSMVFIHPTRGKLWLKKSRYALNQ